ncbi:hypothetical protein GCK32_014751, partial [Trichostrongylus colubriformis]
YTTFKIVNLPTADLRNLIETAKQNGSCLFTYENPCPHTGKRLILSSFTSSTQKQRYTWLCRHNERNLRCVCREDLCNNPTGVMETMQSMTERSDGPSKNEHLKCLKSLEKAFTHKHEKRSITQESDLETSISQQGTTLEATRSMSVEVTSLMHPSDAEIDANKMQVTTTTNMIKLEGSTTTHSTTQDSHEVTLNGRWLHGFERWRDTDEGDPARQPAEHEASSKLTVLIILAGGLMGSAFIVLIMIMFLHESRKKKTTKLKKART